MSRSKIEHKFVYSTSVKDLKMLSVQKDLVPMILKHISPPNVYFFENPSWKLAEARVTFVGIAADSFDDLINKAYLNCHKENWTWIVPFLASASSTKNLAEILAQDTKQVNAQKHKNTKPYINRAFRDSMHSAHKKGFIRVLRVLQ